MIEVKPDEFGHCALLRIEAAQLVWNPALYERTMNGCTLQPRCFCRDSPMRDGAKTLYQQVEILADIEEALEWA